MKAMRLDSMRDGLDRHRTVHRVHAMWAAGCAGGWRVRGRPWRAAAQLLRVWRYAGEERVDGGTRAAVERLVRSACFRGGEIVPLGENLFHEEYVRSRRARDLRMRWASGAVADRVRLRKPRPQDDPERQGNLMILKPTKPETGERGVLLAMYNETFLELPALFDLPRLMRSYRLVLEPSTWGYQDPAFLLYHGADVEVIVLAQHRQDFEYLSKHGHNLAPIRLGAGDWVDPDAFQPRPGAGFEYDVVMVSAWDPVKRHRLLLDALSTIRARRGRTLSVALVGYPLRWRRERIQRLLDESGHSAECAIFESVPSLRVAEIVSRSRVSLLLSLREGANRAIYESLFCNTPVLVPQAHWGVNLDVVNAATGRLFSDADLPDALLSAIDERDGFRPREWALANTGWEVSTRRLNEALKEAATRRGEPWTEDIAGRKSEPNLRYAQAGAWRRFEAAYLTLQDYLRPVD